MTSTNTLISSTTQSTHTGDLLEVALATYTLPANTLPSNGMLRIVALGRRAGTAGSAIFNIRFGGTSGTIYASVNPPAANNDAASFGVFIFADNATNAQKGNKSVGNSYITSSTTYTTSAIDTTANTDIVITGQLGNSADTIKLEAYTIELVAS